MGQAQHNDPEQIAFRWSIKEGRADRLKIEPNGPTVATVQPTGAKAFIVEGYADGQTVFTLYESDRGQARWLAELWAQGRFAR